MSSSRIWPLTSLQRCNDDVVACSFSPSPVKVDTSMLVFLIFLAYNSFCVEEGLLMKTAAFLCKAAQFLSREYLLVPSSPLPVDDLDGFPDLTCEFPNQLFLLLQGVRSSRKYSIIRFWTYFDIILQETWVFLGFVFPSQIIC